MKLGETTDEGLVNYVTESLDSLWSDYESKQKEYEKTKALIEKLEKMPVEEALNKNSENSYNAIRVDTSSSSTTTNSSNDNGYITVFNEKIGEYEVYSEEEMLEGKEEEPVSETEKIKENGLEDLYNYEAEEIKPQLDGAVIVAIIIVAAVLSLLILRKIIFRINNIKKNGRH